MISSARSVNVTTRAWGQYRTGFELKLQWAGDKQHEKAKKHKYKYKKDKDGGKQTKTLWQEVPVPHQIGHDVMVAFDMLPDADDLQDGRTELSVNLSGLQQNKP